MIILFKNVENCNMKEVCQNFLYIFVYLVMAFVLLIGKLKSVFLSLLYFCFHHLQKSTEVVQWFCDGVVNDMILKDYHIHTPWYSL